MITSPSTGTARNIGPAAVQTYPRSPHPPLSQSAVQVATQPTIQQLTLNGDTDQSKFLVIKQVCPAQVRPHWPVSARKLDGPILLSTPLSPQSNSPSLSPSATTTPIEHARCSPKQSTQFSLSYRLMFPPLVLFRWSVRVRKLPVHGPAAHSLPKKAPLITRVTK